MEGHKINKVMIGGEGTSIHDIDGESGLTKEEEDRQSQYRSGNNRKYPSKKGYDDNDSASTGSQGKFAMMTTAGSFRASAISALGIFSLPNRGKKEATPDLIVEDLTKSEMELDQMESNMIGYEHQVRQQQKEEQQQQQKRELQEVQQRQFQHQQHEKQQEQQKEQFDNESSAGTFKDEDDEHTHNSGDSILSSLSRKRRRERIIFYSVVSVLFVIMCALFITGGVIMYRNNKLNGE